MVAFSTENAIREYRIPSGVCLRRTFYWHGCSLLHLVLEQHALLLIQKARNP